MDIFIVIGLLILALALFATEKLPVSFISPLEPACVLVYGPGKYRFADFFKTGIGLTLILMTVVLLLMPFFWPLNS